MQSARRIRLRNATLLAGFLPLALGLAFAKASDDNGNLYVYADPPDAQVRILNIRPRYTPGIELKSARYHLEISRSGYETVEKWVFLPPGEDLEVAISLVAIVETLPEPEILTDRYGIILRRLPAGSLMMSTAAPGSDRKPVREVHIESFYMGKYEVTQAQWRQVMGSDPPLLRFEDCDDCPVERISWTEGLTFINKLNELTGKEYRLPTEVEWEYACRAGSSTEYCFGDEEVTLGEYAWYSANSDNMTHPVGQKKPNSWDLYDMHGNVWEWCQSWHGPDANDMPTGPTGPPTDSQKVRRGGSWSNAARYCKSANSDSRPKEYRNFNLGFRLASSGD